VGVSQRKKKTKNITKQRKRQYSQDEGNHGGHLGKAQCPAGGNAGETDSIQTQSDGRDDRCDCKRRDVSEENCGKAAVSQKELEASGHDDSALNGAHGRLETCWAILNGNELGIKDDTKGCRQKTEGSTLNNGQSITDRGLDEGVETTHEEDRTDGLCRLFTIGTHSRTKDQGHQHL